MRVKNAGGNPRKIFLGDGNAFGLGTDHLLQVLGLIKQYFPQCENINMDATVTSILKKSDDELARLYEKGVRHLYLGIESGLDDVLAFMEKDHNQEQAYEAIERLKKSGLIYDAHIMTGVAGKGRGRENAEALAKFLNETNPAHIVNFSMFIHEEAPLYAHVEDGSFIPADELECLKEEKRLIELLKGNVAGQEILYDGFHDLIEFRVRGNIPKDQEKMITKLNKEIEKFENNLDNCIS